MAIQEGIEVRVFDAIFVELQKIGTPAVGWQNSWSTQPLVLDGVPSGPILVESKPKVMLHYDATVNRASEGLAGPSHSTRINYVAFAAAKSLREALRVRADITRAVRRGEQAITTIAGYTPLADDSQYRSDLGDAGVHVIAVAITCDVTEAHE